MSEEDVDTKAQDTARSPTGPLSLGRPGTDSVARIETGAAA